MMRRLSPVTALLLLVAFGCASGSGDRETMPPASPPFGRELQLTGADATFIGSHALSADVIWASGTNGTYARSTDGGTTWQSGTVPGADSLQFRDVYGVDALTAYVLSIGPGDQSRIYMTADGGANWTLQLTNPEPDGFFDCFAFWDARSGLVFSDSFDGQFYVVTTADGGTTWTRVPPALMPPALAGEGSFAASGTCVTAWGDSTAWIGTGAAATARILKTTDRGRTWSVTATPLVAGPSEGIASVAFRDALHGMALGGDIADRDTFKQNVAVTRDGGASWTLAQHPPFAGAVYGSTFVPTTDASTLVAVGPNGAALTRDDGRTWALLDTLEYWTVTAAAPDAVWAGGPGGRMVRFDVNEKAAAEPK